jgi:indoleamine 2,3-dioxygenase
MQFVYIKVAVMHNGWRVSPDRGFLINPDPLPNLTAVPDLDGISPAQILADIEGVAADMPRLLESGRMRQALDELPMLDLSSLEEQADTRRQTFKRLATQKPSLLKGLKSSAGQAPVLEISNAEHLDYRVIERLWMLYTYFANAYVFANPDEPERCIAERVAVPLYRLAQIVERPPIFSYVTLVLNNWRRVDPDGPIALENLAALQHFLGIPDEHWFGLVHVEVEARAARAIQGIQDAILAAADDNRDGLHQALNGVSDSLGDMLKAFGRMTEGCDPDVYHLRVRPYMFGFENVVYEGVAEYEGKPQTFGGGSGAQSSVIPAIVGALGIQHEQTGLMKHLEGMKNHMPKAHREFIAQVATSAVRDYVKQSGDGALKDAYNRCLQQVMTFRKGHFYYARIYILDKVKNPVGTGGTMFKDWLSQLIAETEAQLL